MTVTDRIDARDGSGSRASTGRAVAAASAIMVASIVLSRVLGMVREMVIAGAGGTSEAVDAYKAAFLLPDILNHVLAGGFLSVTFIPIYARYLAGGRARDGDRTASIVLTAATGLAIVVAAVEWWFADLLVPLAAPGLSGAVRTEAIALTRIVLPAQVFFIPGGVLMAIQMARGRFLLPALAPIAYNGGIILGGVVLGPRFGMAGFAIGVLVGALVGNFALQAFGARRTGFSFRPRFDLGHPDLRKYVLLTLPLALGLTMTFSTEFFFKFFGSRLSEGSIAGLDYALRLMLVLVAVFGQGAGTASYPFLARMAAEGRMGELNALLTQTIRRFVVPVVGAAVLLAVLAPEVVRICYQRGSFTAASAAVTTAALRGFLIGAPAWAASTIVVRGWFAVGNTLTPAVVSTLGVALAVPLYIVFSGWWGVVGVALGSSAAVWLQSVGIYAWWCRRSGHAGLGGVGAALARAVGLAVVLGAGAFAARAGLRAVIDGDTFVGAGAVAGITTVGFVAAALALGPRCGLPELRLPLVRRRGMIAESTREEST